MHAVDINGIKITSEYAVLIGNTAIVADLHIGYEGVLQREGAMIPKYQKEILKRRLKNIIEIYKPKTIIINGDFKHEFGKNLRQEWNEAMEILQFLNEMVEVLLIRGNHDNFLRTIAGKLKIPIYNEYEIKGIKIMHGHKEAEAKRIIMAHEHPSLHLRDKVGAIVKLPCFLISKKIVVMPALSPLATGIDVSSAEPEDYLSPILQKEDIDEYEVYAISDELLYFSKVGKLKKII